MFSFRLTLCFYTNLKSKWCAPCETNTLWNGIFLSIAFCCIWKLFTRCAYLSVDGNIYVCTCFQSITFRFCQLFAFYSQLRVGGKNLYSTMKIHSHSSWWQRSDISIENFHLNTYIFYLAFSFIPSTKTHTHRTFSILFVISFCLEFRLYLVSHLCYICFCFHFILNEVIWEKIGLVNFCMH